LPENEYRFDSPLLGVVKTHDRFEGWCKPSRPGMWTLRILLEKNVLATISQAEVNGKRRGAAISRTALRRANRHQHPEAALWWKLS
jgi:hypothetical protein